MRIEDSFPVHVSGQVAWNFLSDPSAPAACLAGCRSLRLQGEAEVGVALGPARLTCGSEVRITESQPPVHLTASAVGRPPGPGGQPRPDEDLSLRDGGDGTTELHLGADLHLERVPGARGEPVLRAEAVETMRQFADNLRARLEASGHAV